MLPEMLVHQGPARVFEDEASLVAAIEKNEIAAGLRGRHPQRRPQGRPRHARDAHAHVGPGRRRADDSKVALITDGRFSGASRGASIGHVAPEAYDGGPIALVREGDIISIDIPGRRISLDVSDAELAERRAAWQPPVRKLGGVLGRYVALVSGADTGAVLGGDCSGSGQA